MFKKRDKIEDLETRRVMRVCRDGVRRNSMRLLSRREAEERFWDKTKKAGECILWIGAVGGSQSKYGHAMFNGKLQKAHRISWQIANGPIPRGMLVLHRCDTKLCVNANHLFLGSQQDNVDDMIQKGRMRHGEPLRGERSAVAKITQEMVLNVMRLYGERVSQMEIARTTGVHRSSVWMIVHGRIWRHVTGL